MLVSYYIQIAALLKLHIQIVAFSKLLYIEKLLVFMSCRTNTVLKFCLPLLTKTLHRFIKPVSVLEKENVIYPSHKTFMEPFIFTKVWLLTENTHLLYPRKRSLWGYTGISLSGGWSVRKILSGQLLLQFQSNWLDTWQKYPANKIWWAYTGISLSVCPQNLAQTTPPTVSVQLA